MREALAHGADALAAARYAWGAGGSLRQRPNVPEAGEKINISTSVVDGITEPRMSKSILHICARINKILITITA